MLGAILCWLGVHDYHQRTGIYGCLACARCGKKVDF